MNNFQVGDIVKHDFSSEEQGTVTEVRDNPYGVYVKWDSAPERNDWYTPDVLVQIRGGGTVFTMGDIKINN